MKLRFLAALLVCIALTCPGCGRPKTKDTPAKLTVSIPLSGRFPRTDSVVVVKDWLVSIELHPDSLQPLPNRGAAFRDALKLDFRLERGEVSADLYTLPAGKNPERYSQQKRIGRHSAGLNGTIRLTELKDLGFQPLSLRVTAVNEPPPEVVSKAPSIEAHPTGAGGPAANVSLHNLSKRTVVACELKDGPGGTVWFAPAGQSVIGPRASKDIRVSSQFATLSAVLFDDGSWEGDAEEAAVLAGRQIGYSISMRRLTPPIDRIMQDTAASDSAKVDRIKAEIFKPAGPALPSDQQTMALRFPALPKATLQRDLNEGRDHEANALWQELYGYIHSSGQYPPSQPTATAGRLVSPAANARGRTIVRPFAAA